MSRFNSLMISLVGDPNKIETERYFLRVTCLSASIFLLGLCIVHILMNLKMQPVFFAGGSSLVILGLYFILRFKKCLLIPKTILTLLGLIGLDFTWYAKYLSNGPVLFFLLIFVALVIWVWEGRALAIMLTLYFINVALLFFIDYHAPEELFLYPEDRKRSVDIFLSFGLYSFLLLFLLQIVKREYNRQKEKAIRADRLKSAFLANMSHEIRTPMNSIVGFSRLLEKGGTPEEMKQYTSIIQKSSDNLLRLIDDIINLSRIEAGDMEMKLSEVSLFEMFTELKDEYTLELSNRGKSSIKLDMVLPDPGLKCQADPMRLKQVLTNLLDNAVKFTDAGEITLRCERMKDYLQFSVEDTGTGLKAGERERIFEQFVKFNHTRTNYEGSGIGLSIARKIVELSGGRIWVESEEDKGSRFYFTLPCIIPSRVKTTTTESPAAEEFVRIKAGKSVLVVEDDLNSYILISKILEDAGIKSHHAGTGKEAIAFIREHPETPLILMDLKMPRMNGYELTRILKQSNPEIPIIAQTAYAMTGDREKAIEAGCDDYIVKPIRAGNLIKLVKRYLETKQ
jgi:signal transduction histidine kinase/ActR/RegA family two-component response regulator